MASDSEDWNDWASDDDDQSDFTTPIIDLFNPSQTHQTSRLFLQETFTKYGLDLKSYMDDLRLNTYARIRCVNYLRTITQKKQYDPNSPSLADQLTAGISSWKDTEEDYMMPVLEADGLVQYAATANHGFDSDDDQIWSDEDEEEDHGDDTGNNDDNDDNDGGDESIAKQLEINRLQSVQLRIQQRQIEQLSTLLQEARTSFQQYAFDDNGLLATTQNNLVTNTTNNTTSEKPTQFGKSDHYYFESYSNRNIHEEMLSDKHRTESYEESFKQLAPLLKGKIVLDVGCGTGILSMFAARNGAKHVIGVDAADIIDKTREIVVANGFKDQITLVKGKVEEVIIPFDTVDIIVSEWMGYYLLYESMLPSVFYARNKWLRRADTGKSVFEENKQKDANFTYNDLEHRQLSRKFGPETRLMPDVSRMYVAGSNTKHLRARRIDFWKNVYGFDMSVMINKLENYPNSEVDILPADGIVTSSNMYGVFDLMVDTAQELDFCVNDIKLEAISDGIIDSFTVWFDTPFTNPHGNVNERADGELRDIAATTPLATEKAKSKANAGCVGVTNSPEPLSIVQPQDIILTTAPDMVPTHWKQTIFRLNNVIKAEKGDIITIKIKSHTRKDNHRHYDIHFSYSYQTNLKIDPTADTGIPHTSFAKPGDVYDQSYSLQ